MPICLGIVRLGNIPNMTFRKRVLAAMEEQGLSVAETARRADVGYDIIRDLKRREGSSTSAENAEKIAAALGLAGEAATVATRVEQGDSSPAGSTLVPVFDVSASAGYGAINDGEMVAHSLAFPPDYLRRLTTSAPTNLAIISVKGESMEPTLLDDDIVLLDASKTNLSFDGLFVLRFDDALHVKRVGRSARKGHIMIISDNKDLYPPLEIEASEVEPVGKVLWYGRKV